MTMRGFMDSRGFLSFFLGAAVAAACIVLLQPSALCPFDGLTPADRRELAILSNTTHAGPCSNKLRVPATSPDDVRLLALLRRASMDDDNTNTIIMTFANKAWTAPGSLMDLFLESFRFGVRTEPLLGHLVIVAVDAKAYERCTQVHPLCYHLRVRGVDYSSQQSFMEKDYLDMMWRRNRFQARVLQLGYSFVFTDMDMIWLRNPLLRVPVGADLAMSADYFYGDNPYDLNKTANGGFVYAKAGARTVAFYDAWYEARRAYPGKNEQDVFDEVKQALSARHGVRVQFLDTAYLSGFCELRKDFHKVCTVHGNCLFGLKAKLQKLTQVFDEWKQFRADAALMGSSTTALTD